MVQQTTNIQGTPQNNLQQIPKEVSKELMKLFVECDSNLEKFMKKPLVIGYMNQLGKNEEQIRTHLKYKKQKVNEKVGNKVGTNFKKSLVENIENTGGITPPLPMNQAQLTEEEKLLLKLDEDELNDALSSDTNHFKEIEDKFKSKREQRQEKIDKMYQNSKENVEKVRTQEKDQKEWKESQTQMQTFMVQAINNQSLMMERIINKNDKKEPNFNPTEFKEEIFEGVKVFKEEMFKGVQDMLKEFKQGMKEMFESPKKKE